MSLLFKKCLDLIHINKAFARKTSLVRLTLINVKSKGKLSERTMLKCEKGLLGFICQFFYCITYWKLVENVVKFTRLFIAPYFFFNVLIDMLIWWYRMSVRIPHLSSALYFESKQSACDYENYYVYSKR